MYQRTLCSAVEVSLAECLRREVRKRVVGGSNPRFFFILDMVCDEFDTASSMRSDLVVCVNLRHTCCKFADQGCCKLKLLYGSSLVAFGNQLVLREYDFKWILYHFIFMAALTTQF
ncbi:hypothetical protein AVEN_105590-1 [Araneus ventricosus]|uniref:Uncharacterized protein n=1 Tax=Araneus ventricosus TaxID=182803 RepID=A0A4Y2V988_ARAVE|nr:hypothetical protein AVEN_105590-1 [Araneus ventricosus]